MPIIDTPETRRLAQNIRPFRDKLKEVNLIASRIVSDFGVVSGRIPNDATFEVEDGLSAAPGARVNGNEIHRLVSALNGLIAFVGAIEV